MSVQTHSIAGAIRIRLPTVDSERCSGLNEAG
jgi:hypothetical protein